MTTTEKKYLFVFRVVDAETREDVIPNQMINFAFSADEVANGVKSYALAEELGVDLSGATKVEVQNDMGWLTKYSDCVQARRTIYDICSATGIIMARFITPVLIKLWATK